MPQDAQRGTVDRSRLPMLAHRGKVCCCCGTRQAGQPLAACCGRHGVALLLQVVTCPPRPTSSAAAVLTDFIKLNDTLTLVASLMSTVWCTSVRAMGRHSSSLTGATNVTCIATVCMCAAGRSEQRRVEAGAPDVASCSLTCSTILPSMHDSCLRFSTRKTGLLSAPAAAAVSSSIQGACK